MALRMTRHEGALWLLVALGSGWLSWKTWLGPPETSWPPTPPALPRPATPEERAQVDALADGLSAQLESATTALGRPLRVEELEGQLPDGRPILEGGLPDNPLLPGVGGVEERCEPLELRETSSAPDWRFCPAEARMWPNLPP